jgi:hypothetical protein
MRHASRIRERTDARGAGLSPAMRLGCSRVRKGQRNTSGSLRRRNHGSQTTGMAAGVKPRSREAVRVFARGFTRDDSPGEDECGGGAAEWVLVAGDGGFWYSLEVCRSAAGASMAVVSTTGFRRCVRGAETGVRPVPFAIRNFSRAESAGSASIRAVRAGRRKRSSQVAVGQASC